MKHFGTKILQTKRLVLRPFEEGDHEMMYKNWASDEQVTRYLLWHPHKDPEETKKTIASWIKRYRKKNYYQWGLLERSSGELIGSVTLFAPGRGFILTRKYKSEIGYCLGRPWWGEGLAYEAVGAVLEFAFLEMEALKVYARHDHRNPASGRLLMRLGMDHVKLVRKSEVGRDNKLIDIDYYELDRRAYLKQLPMGIFKCWQDQARPSKEKVVSAEGFLYNK